MLSDTENWISPADENALLAALNAAFLVTGDFRAEGGEAGDCIELGSWQGRSAVIIARHLESQYPPYSTPRVLHCVDHWKGDLGVPANGLAAKAAERDVFAEFEHTMIEANVRNYRAHRGDWREFFPWGSGFRKIRFLFIDAQHTYGEVYDQIRAALPQMLDGGVICGDDYHMVAVRQAVLATLGGRYEIDVTPGSKIWRAVIKHPVPAPPERAEGDEGELVPTANTPLQGPGPTVHLNDAADAAKILPEGTKVVSVVPYLGTPTASRLHDYSQDEALESFDRAFGLKVRRVHGCSLLAFAMNVLYADALNMRQPRVLPDGRSTVGVTHFIMLHDDIVPLDDPKTGQCWAQTLIGQMVAHDLGALCVLAPQRNDSGWTSTAIERDPSDPMALSLMKVQDFKGRRIITSREERRLLINTGCLCVDLTKPWSEKLFFHVKDGIRKNTKTGRFEPWVDSEDYNMSRMLRGMGVHYGCTAAVRLRHLGRKAYENWADEPTPPVPELRGPEQLAAAPAGRAGAERQLGVTTT